MCARDSAATILVFLCGGGEVTLKLVAGRLDKTCYLQIPLLLIFSISIHLRILLAVIAILRCGLCDRYSVDLVIREAFEPIPEVLTS